MADKAISELVSANQIMAEDMFVLEQTGEAKKLTGQVLLNWLTAAADGHGGIQSIEQTGTQGLVDTYTITLADTTVFYFSVANGKGIQSITKIATVGLVDNYRVLFSDGTSQDYTVTNGSKGDSGDNAYVHIKWASQQPTLAFHSFGDIPDNWMGVYSGSMESAPTDWQLYSWFEVKGAKGDTGEAASIVSQETAYQIASSGTIIPSGDWSSVIPVVPSGKYLWTRVIISFNSGNPVISYSVSRMGIDGAGAVSTVNNVAPDTSGNVSLKANDIDAMATTGGDFIGEVRMNGQKLTGLNDPTEDIEAARKGYVDTKVSDVAAYTNTFCRPNLLDNWYFPTAVNQRGLTIYNAAGFCIDRWRISNDNTALTLDDGAIKLSGYGSGHIKQTIPNSDNLNGKVVTLSALIRNPDSTAGIALYNNTNDFQICDITADPSNEYKMITGTVLLEEEAGTALQFIIYPTDLAATESKDIFVMAAKLELGGTQTLAHQDASGEWVLNEIPGYGEQLARCQRYYIRFAEPVVASGYLTTGATEYTFSLPLPVEMRTKAAIANASLLTVRVPLGGYSSKFPLDGALPNSYSIPFQGGNMVTVIYKVNSAVDTNNTSIACKLEAGFALTADL